MKRAFLLVTLFALFLGLSEIHAWVEPTLPPTGGNVTAPLRLDANGRLGIGLSTAVYKLDVYGPAASYPVRVATPDGYLTFGPANANWSHFNTDRPRFYFNKGITVDTGLLGSYNGNLDLQTSGTTRLSILNTNGNVGIGNLAPAYKLDVTGDVNVPTGSCYRVNGVCLTSGGLAGSGTANYLPKFTAATTLGDSRIIDNGTNVGIGIAAPLSRLQVVGDLATNPTTGAYAQIEATGLTNSNNRLALGYNTTGDYGVIQALRNASGFRNLILQPGGSNIGIGGETAPASKVEVRQSSTGTGVGGTNGAGAIRVSFSSGFGVGIDTWDSGVPRWGVLSYNGDTPTVVMEGTYNSPNVIFNAGNVGMGTAAPTQRLTVSGNINKLGSWIASDLNWDVGNFEVHNNLWDGISNNNYGGVIGGKLYAYRGLQSGGATGGEATDGELYVSGRSMLMGNVGIGKNNPSNTLDVAGGMNVTGSVDGSSLAFITNTHPTGGIGLSATAQINGIYGYAQNTSGWGVRGVGGGSAGTGVRGEGYYGVRGQAQNGPAYATYGVYGATEGIYGTGAYGIYCHATSPSSLCGGNKTWTNTSDIRLKKNISTVTNGLDKVLKLRGVNYQWKEGDTETKNIGFIAQEVLEVVPEVVSKGSDGYYVMRESSLSAVLVEAIKELKAENDDLKARLERLEAKIK